MKKAILFLCVLGMLDFMPVKAQKVWSLQECFNYALENNLHVKRQELNVQYSKNNLTQSYFNTMPSFNAGVNYGYSSGKSIDMAKLEYVNVDYWSGDMGLNGNLTLFSGLQTYNNILKSKYDYLKSQADLEKSKNDMALLLTRAYLQILFAKELTDVAAKKLEVTSMQAERTRKMMEVGNVAQGEYLQIKAQESDDKTALINAQNDRDIAYLDLTQLLDLDSVAGFEIVVPMNMEVAVISPLESVQNIFDVALKTMPEIQSADYALKSSERELAMAWGQVSPTLDLSGNLSSRYSPNVDDPVDPDGTYTAKEQLGDNFYKQVTFGLSIPIFNKLQIKNSISNAKLQVNDTKLQYDIAKNALYKEVQQAHADASAAREKYYSTVEAVKYNEEAFKYTSQKFEVGLVNSVDYNISQKNLISAQSNMLQAKYEYIFKLKILDLYMDKPIVL
jgi:outer membrane protein